MAMLTPPPSPAHPMTPPPPPPQERFWDETEFWCQAQVRWWATLRGQTLGRTIFGLMEMREALVDTVVLELKAVQRLAFVDMDYHSPDARATLEDVLAWLHRNRLELFSASDARTGTFTRRSRVRSLYGQDALRHALTPESALGAAVCAELAMGLFLRQLRQQRPAPPAGEGGGGGEAPARPPATVYGQLVAKDGEGRYALAERLRGEVTCYPNAVEALLGKGVWDVLDRAVNTFAKALGALEQKNELRLKAEQIVQDKFQVRRRGGGPCSLTGGGRGGGRGPPPPPTPPPPLPAEVGSRDEHQFAGHSTDAPRVGTMDRRR